jgi:opacity protein-like surface antigen
MPRQLWTIALALLVLPLVASRAQIGYGVAAGASAPLGDFGKAVESGYHLTGLVTLGIPLAPVGGRLEGSFSEFNYKNVANGAKARILSATANGTLSTPGIVGPYFIGGIGVYRATAECSTCTTSSTKVGFNGGGGMKIGIGALSVFAEARYHYIGGASDPTNGGVKSSTQFIPLSFGLTF